MAKFSHFSSEDKSSVTYFDTDDILKITFGPYKMSGIMDSAKTQAEITFKYGSWNWTVWDQEAVMKLRSMYEKS